MKFLKTIIQLTFLRVPSVLVFSSAPINRIRSFFILYVFFYNVIFLDIFKLCSIDNVISKLLFWTISFQIIENRPKKNGLEKWHFSGAAKETWRTDTWRWGPGKYGGTTGAAQSSGLNLGMKAETATYTKLGIWKAVDAALVHSSTWYSMDKSRIY
jgi:hypothetical protein